MTNEEKKFQLSRYRELWADIEIKQQEIETLRSRAEKVTRALSSVSASGSGRQDFTVTIDRIIALQTELDKLIQEAISERYYLESLINAVHSPLHRRVLQRRYINGNTFEQIAVYENRNYKHIVNRIHPEALKMINFGNDVC